MDYRPLLKAEYNISATNFPYYDYDDQVFQYIETTLRNWYFVSVYN